MLVRLSTHIFHDVFRVRPRTDPTRAAADRTAPPASSAQRGTGAGTCAGINKRARAPAARPFALTETGL